MHEKGVKSASRSISNVAGEPAVTWRKSRQCIMLEALCGTIVFRIHECAKSYFDHHTIVKKNMSDFLNTLGREFCNQLQYVDDDVCNQDAYEIFSNALGPRLAVERLQALTDEDYDRLASACAKHLEHNRVSLDHLRLVVQLTLEHWR
ncbi:MAG: hypothetical protein AAGA09_03690 [Pseudomonadota bacterium]